ncbi:peptidoglycan-binding domain-containing protein [Alteromonas sp. 1_MG-2023]|uniref:peptidoglycan-binding domain-containing protein n=1 Tax=Alteromonas sp. 1_MG-2023 TaxID=3062669 RepID=UPI0026E442E6|nr:peptidoglycan-binding domain-containing protein [Alteromonas sp. 1_MG-2023]MDO6568654.1 peptidoglycan-binding domain-containing protein [Alteromonas sp. 1_MG-2023]
MMKFVLSLSVILLSFSAQAADSEGAFNTKGAAKRSCEAFTSTYAEQGSETYLYGGWLEGYITAFNALQQKTFDVTPWQTTELMLLMLNKHCTDNPEQKFLDATNVMLKAFLPTRLAARSDIIEMTINDSTIYIYQSVLDMTTEALKASGYNVDIAESEFNASYVKAITQYQQAKGIAVTGFPDQQTLVNLLLVPVK